MGRVIESLHKNGRVNEVVEKQDGKKVEVEKKTLDQSKDQTKGAEGMQWEKSEDHVKGKNVKKNFAPSPSMFRGS